MTSILGRLHIMAKSREKVQQLGFWDTEVSKPDHDSICLWAYRNPETIFRAVNPELFDHPWMTDEIHFDRDHRDEAANALAKAFADANQRPNPRVYNKELEYVLKSYSGYGDRQEKIVGYADLLLETELPGVFPTYKPSSRGYSQDEFDNFTLKWSRGRPAPRILVEVKSFMPTMGELMRQINLYRTAFTGRFVVVSPDDSYADILKEQGVTFVKYSL